MARFQAQTNAVLDRELDHGERDLLARTFLAVDTVRDHSRIAGWGSCVFAPPGHARSRRSQGSEDAVDGQRVTIRRNVEVDVAYLDRWYVVDHLDAGRVEPRDEVQLSDCGSTSV